MGGTRRWTTGGRGLRMRITDEGKYVRSPQLKVSSSSYRELDHRARYGTLPFRSP